MRLGSKVITKRDNEQHETVPGTISVPKVLEPGFREGSRNNGNLVETREVPEVLGTLLGNFFSVLVICNGVPTASQTLVPSFLLTRAIWCAGIISILQAMLTETCVSMQGGTTSHCILSCCVHHAGYFSWMSGHGMAWSLERHRKPRDNH